MSKTEDGTAAGELHPTTRLGSAYDADPEQAGVGSASPAFDAEGDEEPVARDAGAPFGRDRGPAASGAPTTDQT